MNLTIPKAASLGPATERDLQVAKAVQDAVMTLLNVLTRCLWRTFASASNICHWRKSLKAARFELVFQQAT